MMQREIPGFYFDQDKQKYFRIQKNHVLPAGAAYTRASVKVIKDTKEKHERLTTLENRIRSTKVTRSRLSRLSNVLGLRLGSKPISQARDTIAEIYAQSLSYRPVVSDINAILPHDRQVPEYSGFSISDDACLLTTDAQGRYTTIARPIDEPRWRITARTDPQHNQQLEWRGIFHVEMQPRGVHRLLASAGDYFVGVSELDTHVALGVFSRSSDRQLRTFDVSEDLEVWNITGSHTSVGPTFAMATSRGVSLLTIPPTGPMAMRMCHGYRQHEQMAVAFKERDVVMSGERSGRVNLTDIRSPDSTIVRLQHSSAVSSLSATKNQSEILVQGLSTTSIYDLRYNKAQPRPERRSSRQKISSRPCLNVNVPVDRRSDQYILGGRKVAYSSDLNLIVAASCRNNPHQAVSPHTRHGKINRVTLYSAKTGRMVPSPINDHVFNSPVTCLDVKKIRDGPESIVVLEGGRLSEWTIHDERDNGVRQGGVKPRTGRKQVPNGSGMNIVNEWG